jgi:hypothetical protein
MMPKMMAKASQLKTGSSVIIKLPNIVVPALSKTGLMHTSPAAKSDCLILMPLALAKVINSTKISEFLTTMPASAIMPIIAVAVNNIGSGAPAISRSPSC